MVSDASLNGGPMRRCGGRGGTYVSAIVHHHFFCFRFIIIRMDVVIVVPLLLLPESLC